ncbi:hypothetical protein ACIQLK_05740 [Microbacterium sp. NPDC091382]|uniref:hypothetical protein n=1 Tax=Microbacterium sp. NPDC091382 TaxID=3364210 RepID=UPI0038165709
MKVRTLIVVTASLLTLALPSGAQANELPPTEVCTVGALAIPEGDPAPEAVPLVISCFETATEAEAFIEEGAPGDYEQLVDGGSPQGRVAAAATVTIGRVWTGTSRGGSELIHWGTGSGCNGVTYGFPTLPSGWNNNIRSAQGYSNCWASHYDSTSYKGQVLTCAPYCSTMGFLAAKSSSIVYRPVGTFG